MTTTEATISRWLAALGDPLDVDTPLLGVATDKVDTEIPSPHTGVLLDILVAENPTVPVGSVLATITVGRAQPAAQAPPLPAPPAPEAIPVVSPATHTSPASEKTRAPRHAGPSPQDTATVQRLPRIRQTIARRMKESLHNSAQLTTVVEVDVTEIGALRGEHKARLESGFSIEELFAGE